MMSNLSWALVQLLIYVTFAGSTATSVEAACPHLLFVAGNRDYPYVEGLYLLQTSRHDNRPIYRHSCHDIYIYYEEESTTWWIGPDVGGATGYALLYTDNPTPLTSEDNDIWRYWKHSEGTWLYDNDAKMVCLDLTCQRLEVQGQGLPNKTKGAYHLTDMIHQDRPVYKSLDGSLYIYHGHVSVVCNVWFLGTNVGSQEAVIFAYDNAKAPQNIKALWTLRDRVTRYGDLGITQREGLNVSVECIEGSMFKKNRTTVSPSDSPEANNDSKSINNSNIFKDCGYVTAQKSGLVSQLISGRNSSFQGKWPWMVAILKSDNKTKCGAAIISNRYLLTAAHCIDGSNSSLLSYQLLMGANSRTANEQHTQRYKIKRTILHENFTYTSSPFRLLNDIGIIEVDRNIVFTQYISPVCLPETPIPVLPYSSVESQFEECYVIGFGNYHVDASGSTSTGGGVLQEQIVSLQTIGSCSRRYFYTYAWLRNSNNICVRPANYGKLCQGDSGSPLMCRRGDQWTLTGVASWSFAACISGSVPSIYVDITKHADWITQQLEN